MAGRSKDGKAEGLSITACAIVRNEAGNICKWLEAARCFADEIVVVDTGSVDETVAILREHGVEPIEIEWADDFAGAKNVALEAAHGDWIVFTDADEVFVEPEAVRDFLTAVDGRGIDIVMVPLFNVDRDGREMDRLELIRIFRRLPKLRYAGRIHEELRLEGGPLNMGRLTRAGRRLLVRHTGYAGQAPGEKRRRNLRILLREQAELGENPARFCYIADCYIGMRDYAKALDYSLRFIQSGYRLLGREAAAYGEALICLEKLGYGVEDRLAVIAEGLARNPDLPDFYGARGIICAELGRYQEAYGLLHKAVADFDARQRGSGSAKESGFGGSYLRALYMLGICARELGRYEEWADCFFRALQLKPYQEMPLVVLADCFDGAVCQEVLSLIEMALPDWQEQRSLLAGIFARHGFVELALYFGAEDLSRLTGEQGMQAAGRIAQAVPRLFAALLGNEAALLVHDYRSPAEMLPEDVQNLLRFCFDGEFYPELALVDGLYEELLQEGTQGRVGKGATEEIDEREISRLALAIAADSLYLTAVLVRLPDSVPRYVRGILPPAYQQLLDRDSIARGWNRSYEENALCRLLMYIEKMNKG